jgi:hypothetical protein
MRETSNWRSLWREMAVDARKLSIGGYLLIGSLVSLLAGVIVFGGLAWSLGEGTAVPAFGYVAMAAGVLFSLVLGIGLMALRFAAAALDTTSRTRSCDPTTASICRNLIYLVIPVRTSLRSLHHASLLAGGQIPP